MELFLTTVILLIECTSVSRYICGRLIDWLIDGDMIAEATWSRFTCKLTTRGGGGGGGEGHFL